VTEPDASVPDWFMRAAAGHRKAALRSVRNKLKSGRVYTIARFVGQPGMVSEYGAYKVGLMVIGNQTTVFDPRNFRPETV
jgi:hypothetical protein